jgi:hypothetical protein
MRAQPPSAPTPPTTPPSPHLGSRLERPPLSGGSLPRGGTPQRPPPSKARPPSSSCSSLAAPRVEGGPTAAALASAVATVSTPPSEPLASPAPASSSGAVGAPVPRRCIASSGSRQPAEGSSSCSRSTKWSPTPGLVTACWGFGGLREGLIGVGPVAGPAIRCGVLG